MSRKFDTRFIGSFFALDQLPKDRLPQIAIAGRSNVGKSSLLNQILGQKRIAKVSQTPGKTRSLNFFMINERFYFVDLPGYGYAKVSKKMRRDWASLMEAYLSESVNLVGLVMLLDCRRELNDDDHTMLSWLADRELPLLMVITKVDKISRTQANAKVLQIESELGVPALPFSTKTGVGKQQLIGSVLDLVS